MARDERRLRLDGPVAVGSILDRAWVNGDMSHYQTGVQTVAVPAGGGGVFDVKIDDEGLYPFVSHASPTSTSARSVS